MRDEDKRSLSKVRLERAEECLTEAQSLYEAENIRARQTVFITQSFMPCVRC